ncbi:MAG: hypothetical protein ACRDH9_12440 [Actinomycetota bacterium]
MRTKRAVAASTVLVITFTFALSAPPVWSASRPAARKLRAAPDCDPPGTPVVGLRWAPGRGTAQRVQYTEFFNGFETGQFDRSRRLEGDDGRHRLRGTVSGYHYRWRVVTLYGRKWVASRIDEFDGPVCVQDQDP